MKSTFNFCSGKLARAVLLSGLLNFLGAGAIASSNSGGYAGLEFYGAAHLTRVDLEKMIALKVGAPPSSVEKAADRLNKQLAARHLDATVNMVQGEDDTIYLAVDVLDSTVDNVPVRRLRAPRHVLVANEKPFQILEQLDNRLAELNTQGRACKEFYKDGAKYYPDEVANELVHQIQKYFPLMTPDLIAVVESDPNSSRRKSAIELLGWAGSVSDIGVRLIPALDDSDAAVRVSVVRYFYPRLSYLSADFPIEKLVEGASRELNRPSHQDRSKALYLLLALCKKDRGLIRQIKTLDQQRVSELNEKSVLPTIKIPSQELISIFQEWDKGPLG